MATGASLEIVRNTEKAAVLMNPVRLKLLGLLAEPASAARVADKAGIKRQIANYHLRELEKAGFLALVEERKRGSVSERILKASAAAYTLSPEVLGPLALDPDSITDRFSLEYLAALASRALGEIGSAAERASSLPGPTPMMAVESAISFRSVQERAAFAKELSAEVSRLAAKYHDPSSTDSESFRFVLIAHPKPRQP